MIDVESDMMITRYGFLNEEEGPNDHRGVALRVLTPHPTALDGFTRDVVEFWGSYDAYQRDAAAVRPPSCGRWAAVPAWAHDEYDYLIINDDLEAEGVVICDSLEMALELANNEPG